MNEHVVEFLIFAIIQVLTITSYIVTTRERINALTARVDKHDRNIDRFSNLERQLACIVERTERTGHDVGRLESTLSEFRNQVQIWILKNRPDS